MNTLDLARRIVQMYVTSLAQEVAQALLDLVEAAEEISNNVTLYDDDHVSVPVSMIGNLDDTLARIKGENDE